MDDWMKPMTLDELRRVTPREPADINRKLHMRWTIRVGADPVPARNAHSGHHAAGREAEYVARLIAEMDEDWGTKPASGGAFFGGCPLPNGGYASLYRHGPQGWFRRRSALDVARAVFG